MMECKAMTTPMASNINLFSVSSSELVDAMMYRQMMYLTNMRLDICFVVNTLRHVHLMVAKHVVRYLKGTVEYGIKCNFRMYSLVFLMYCNPMFILGCVCNVFESFHAPMLLSGGSIM